MNERNTKLNKFELTEKPERVQKKKNTWSYNSESNITDKYGADKYGVDKYRNSHQQYKSKQQHVSEIKEIQEMPSREMKKYKSLSSESNKLNRYKEHKNNLYMGNSNINRKLENRKELINDNNGLEQTAYLMNTYSKKEHTSKIRNSEKENKTKHSLKSEKEEFFLFDNSNNEYREKDIHKCEKIQKSHQIMEQEHGEEYGEEYERGNNFEVRRERKIEIDGDDTETNNESYRQKNNKDNYLFENSNSSSVYKQNNNFQKFTILKNMDETTAETKIKPCNIEYKEILQMPDDQIENIKKDRITATSKFYNQPILINKQEKCHFNNFEQKNNKRCLKNNEMYESNVDIKNDIYNVNSVRVASKCKGNKSIDYGKGDENILSKKCTKHYESDICVERAGKGTRESEREKEKEREKERERHKEEKEQFVNWNHENNYNENNSNENTQFDSNIDRQFEIKGKDVHVGQRSNGNCYTHGSNTYERGISKSEWREHKDIQEEIIYNKNYSEEKTVNNYTDGTKGSKLEFRKNVENVRRNSYFEDSYDQNKTDKTDKTFKLKDKQKMVKDIMEHIYSDANNEDYFYNYQRECDKTLDTFINDTCNDYINNGPYNEEMCHSDNENNNHFKNIENANDREKEMEGMEGEEIMEGEERMEGEEGMEGEEIMEGEEGMKKEGMEEEGMEEEGMDENMLLDSNRETHFENEKNEQPIYYLDERDALVREALVDNDIEDVGNEQGQFFLNQSDYDNGFYEKEEEYKDEIEDFNEKDEVIKELLEEAKNLQKDIEDNNKKETEVQFRDINLVENTNLYNEIQSKCKEKLIHEDSYSTNNKLILSDAQNLDHLKNEEQILWEESNNFISPGTLLKNKDMIIKEKMKNDITDETKCVKATKNVKDIKNTKLRGQRTGLKTGGISSSNNNVPHKNINSFKVTKKENINKVSINRTNFKTNFKTNFSKTNIKRTAINKTEGNKGNSENCDPSNKKKAYVASRSPTSCQNKNTSNELKLIKKDCNALYMNRDTQHNLIKKQQPLNKLKSFVKSNIPFKQVGIINNKENAGNKSNISSKKNSDKLVIKNNTTNLSNPNSNIKTCPVVSISNKNEVNIQNNPTENIKERSKNNLMVDMPATNAKINKTENITSMRNIKNINKNNKNSSSISSSISSSNASMNIHKKRNFNNYKMDLIKQKEPATDTKNKSRKINSQNETEELHTGELLTKELPTKESVIEDSTEKEAEQEAEKEAEKDRTDIGIKSKNPTSEREIKAGGNKNNHPINLNNRKSNDNNNNNNSSSTVANKNMKIAAINLKNKNNINLNDINLKTTEKWKTTSISGNSTLSSNASQSCRNLNKTSHNNMLKRNNTIVNSNMVNKGSVSKAYKGINTTKNKGDMSKESTNSWDKNNRNINKQNKDRNLILKENINKSSTVSKVSNSSSFSSINKENLQIYKQSVKKIDKRNIPNIQNRKKINNNTNNLKDVVAEEMKKFTNGRKYKLKSNSIPPGGNIKNAENIKKQKEEHDDLNIEKKIENIDKNSLIKRNSDIMNYGDVGTNLKPKPERPKNEKNDLHTKNKYFKDVDNSENKEKKKMSYFEWLAYEKKRKELDETKEAEEIKEDALKEKIKNNSNSDADLDEVENENLMLEPLSAFNLRQNQKTYEQNDFIVDRHPIGNGRTGLVFKAIIRNENERVALKVMAKDTICTLNIERQVLKEIIIQASLKHINILELIAYFEDKTRLFLILELANGGSIRNKMKLQSEPLKEEEVALYVYQIADALSYLHKFNIIHRDLKPDNILIHYSDEYIDNKIYKYGIIKLADFGFSCQLKNKRQKRSTFCGTVDYMPPEIINQVPYDCNVDLWCLGIVIFELLVGFPPFTDDSQERIFNQIKELKFHFPKTVPLTAQELILKLCSRTADERISAEEVKSHPWIKQFI